jgi:hypothetical protein
MSNIISKFICVSEEVELSKLESNSPFLILESNHIDGYYSNLPVEHQTPLEHHYFMLAKTNIHCFQDRVIRSISFYEKDHNKVLHIYPGHVDINGKSFLFIRFRQNEFDEVMNMLPYFERRGIVFKKDKKFSPARVLIQFKELVEMEELKPGIYRDKSAHHVFFLPINVDIEYNTFDKMITFIRNNCDFKHFEASLVYSVNAQYKVEDFAKIYSPKCEEERLQEFDDYFMKAAEEFGVK